MTETKTRDRIEKLAATIEEELIGGGDL